MPQTEGRAQTTGRGARGTRSSQSVRSGERHPAIEGGLPGNQGQGHAGWQTASGGQQPFPSLSLAVNSCVPLEQFLAALVEIQNCLPLTELGKFISLYLWVPANSCHLLATGYKPGTHRFLKKKKVYLLHLLVNTLTCSK